METLNESDSTESLYKIRDVGATLNDTFAYFRKNFSHIFLPLVLIVWPLKVVFTFIFKTRLQSAAMYNPYNGTEGVMSTFLTSALLGFIIGLLAQMANTIIVVYIGYKEEHKQTPSFGEIVSGFLKKLPKVFIVGIITGVMVIVGCLFLLIPGLYLIIVFSIILPVIVVENKGIFDSIGRCFKLINDRFWSTVGLVIILGVIIFILDLLGEIPTFVVTISERLSGFGNQYYNPDPYSARVLIPLLIAQLVNTLTYAIYVVGITTWYYSLVEEKDGVSAGILLDKIKDKQVTGNEGEF